MKLWNIPFCAFVILIWGHTRRYSGLTTGSALSDDSWWDHMGCWESTQVWLHAGQKPYPLYCLAPFLKYYERDQKYFKRGEENTTYKKI